MYHENEMTKEKEYTGELKGTRWNDGQDEPVDTEVLAFLRHVHGGLSDHLGGTCVGYIGDGGIGLLEYVVDVLARELAEATKLLRAAKPESKALVRYDSHAWITR